MQDTQETFEESAKDFIENTMKFSFNSLETKTQANRMLKCVEFGVKWQADRSISLEKQKVASTNESKLFARWLIIHTEDVDTIGACRRYKKKIYNVDELYDIFISLT